MCNQERYRQVYNLLMSEKCFLNIGLIQQKKVTKNKIIG